MQASNLLWIYNYLTAIRLPTHNAQLAEFPTILDYFFINTTSNYIGVEGEGWSTTLRWNGLDKAIKMSQNIDKSMVYIMNKSGGDFQ